MTQAWGLAEYFTECFTMPGPYGVGIDMLRLGTYWLLGACSSILNKCAILNKLSILNVSIDFENKVMDIQYDDFI